MSLMFKIEVPVPPYGHDEFYEKKKQIAEWLVEMGYNSMCDYAIAGVVAKHNQYYTSVWFIDRAKAATFKLAWGGK